MPAYPWGTCEKVWWSTNVYTDERGTLFLRTQVDQTAVNDSDTSNRVTNQSYCAESDAVIDVRKYQRVGTSFQVYRNDTVIERTVAVAPKAYTFRNSDNQQINEVKYTKSKLTLNIGGFNDSLRRVYCMPDTDEESIRSDLSV